MNSPRVKAAIREAFNKLAAMSKEELEALIKEHESGSIAELIIKSGMLDVGEQEVSAWYEYQEHCHERI